MSNELHFRLVRDLSEWFSENSPIWSEVSATPSQQLHEKITPANAEIIQGTHL
jgi:hypothetical protein